MKIDPDILKWSNIAFNLANALIEEVLDGTDGPKKLICFPPCNCLMHTALQNWGDAQIELLDKIDPNWREKRRAE